jgi:serine-type D-Ala-D-Ala carboxypeptidase
LRDTAGVARLRSGTPEDAGFSPERLALVRHRAEEWVTKRDVHRTLVLLVARDGVIALHEAFGVDGPEPTAEPLTVDAIFPLLSQSKPITATLIMQLVEEGLVGLARPVQDYLPEFVGERKETILVHHLLTHTSGIDDGDLFVATARLLPHMVGSAENALPGQHPIEHLFLELSYVWPAAHPVGEVMRYCQINYLLLGEIVRRVSGRSLDELARERIFGPLGMDDTSYGAPDEKVDRVVRRDFTEDPATAFAHSERGRGMLGGAGGAYSTARDLAAFMQMFLDRGGCDGGRVLHPSSVERMTTDQIPGVPSQFLGRTLRSASMGLGWLVANSEPTLAWPMPPDGSILHGGAGLILPWADPRSGVVGVFCSVADRMRVVDGSPIDVRHHADLFTSLVTAAVAG